MNNDPVKDLLEKSNLQLDDNFKADKLLNQFNKKRKKRRIIYLILFLSFALLNTILYEIYVTDLKSIFTSEDVSVGSIFFLGCAIWGFLLSLVFSLIPKKGSTFKTRYLNVSLLIMFTINVYFTLIGTIIVYSK